jgi:ribosome-associated toxin RatA of RatAB toxin-antitoxin module
MGKIGVGWVVGWLALVPFTAQAQEWETIMTGPVTIKARSRPNSPIREIWAETDLNASVQDLQEAILDAEAYPRFMPFVKESRYIGKREGDEFLVYTHLQPPIVQGRDYVVKVLIEKNNQADGTFENRWFAVPDKVPLNRHLVRLKHNEGSWTVKPKGEGRSHVIYKFAVDPGGWLPGFVADMGNKTGVVDTLRALEREAQRRAVQRKDD